MTDNTRFRIDKVEKLSPDATMLEYRVPCGMNSIVYVGRIHPKRTTIMSGLPKLDGAHVYIISAWSDLVRDYVVQEVIGRKL